MRAAPAGPFNAQTQWEARGVNQSHSSHNINPISYPWLWLYELWSILMVNNQWFIGIYNNHYKDPYYGWDDHQPYSEY